MIQCPTCRAVHPSDSPCPGCLLGLALSEAPPPQRGPSLLTFALGSLFGASVGVTVFGAGALVWMSTATPAASPIPAQLAEMREHVAEVRDRLEDVEDALADDRRRLAEQVDERVIAPRGTTPTTANPDVDGPYRARAAAAAAAAAAARRAAHAEGEGAASEALDASVHAEKARAAAEQARAEAAARAASAAREREIGAACGGWPALEAQAILGRLSSEQRSCLEGLAEGPLGDQALRALMVDAFSAGDAARWEAFAVAHTERHGPDADIVYKLARHTAQAGRHEDALRWSAVALDRRHAWRGVTLTQRVDSLHALRFRSSHALWGAADPRVVAAGDAWREVRVALGKEIPAELAQ